MAEETDISVRPLSEDERFKIQITNDAASHGGSGMSGYSAPNEKNSNKTHKSLPEGTYTVIGRSNYDPSWVCISIDGKDVWIKLNGGGSFDKDGNPHFNSQYYSEEDRDKALQSEMDILGTMNFEQWATDSYDERTIGELAGSNECLVYTYDKDGNARPMQEKVVMHTTDSIIEQGSVYAHYVTLATKAYGAPPQWTSFVDPRIGELVLSSNHVFLLGRKYLETVISAPTILSLCPGVIKYNSALGNLLGEENFNDMTAEMFQSDSSGKIIEFQPCWYSDVEGGNHGYLKYVITLNKATLVSMNRSEHKDGEVELKYREFPGTSYTYYDTQKVWTDWNNSDNDATRIFGDTNGENVLLDTLSAVGNAAAGFLESLYTYKYVHFYCSGNNSTRENFETSVRSSMIEDLINSSVGSAVKDVAYFMGGIMDATTKEQLESWADTTSKELGSLGNLVSMATEVFKGARLIFPQIVDDCTFGREAQFTVRFVAGSSDIESRYLMRCEFNHLLALVLPRQVKGKIDMYTTPFLVRGLCKGRWNCEMGVITGFQVTYGGQDDGAWTQDSQPTEIEATFSITPLYSKLVMSSFDDASTWFLRNTGMIEYIMTNCGVDLRLSQLNMKVEMAKAMGSEAVNIARLPDGIMGMIYNMAQPLRNLLNF